MNISPEANAAAGYAEAIAFDDSHGYDQGSRWGNPDYDCSALLCDIYERAGVHVRAYGASYTGNMKRAFLACGFIDVRPEIDLATGAGLLRGDVLLNEVHHTAICIGNGKLVHATGNEFGGVTGGQPGDQTGKEICVANYFNYGSGGWDCVLRYPARDASPDPADDPVPVLPSTYTVKQGDSLWAIAGRLLGDYYRYEELRQINGLSGYTIYPGQVLILPGAPQPPPAGGCSTITVTVKDATLAALKAAAGARTIGEYLDELMKEGQK